MKLNIKFEYYPEITDSILEDSINDIKHNKDLWDSPFFFDTKTYLDINQIHKQLSNLLQRILRI